MARGAQLGRQWRIIQTLLAATRGKTVAELAERLGCHPRTVYRDLEALESGGFPLYCERDGGANRWALLDAVRTQVPIPLDLTELMALTLGRGTLHALMRETLFSRALDALYEKINATLPDAYRDRRRAKTPRH